MLFRNCILSHFFNLTSSKVLVTAQWLVYGCIIANPLKSLKVLTQKSFLFKICFYTPKGPPKHISKKSFQKKRP